jgi:hypothetical protein
MCLMFLISGNFVVLVNLLMTDRLLNDVHICFTDDIMWPVKKVRVKLNTTIGPTSFETFCFKIEGSALEMNNVRIFIIVLITHVF